MNQRCRLTYRMVERAREVHLIVMSETLMVTSETQAGMIESLPSSV